MSKLARLGHLPECKTYWAKNDNASCICEYLEKRSKRTEERIIKLLEADSVGYCNCKWGINELDSGELVDVQEFICDPHRYIALIKGENK